MTNYSEAREDAQRLTRITGRDVEVQPVTCTCDYDKSCGKCAGEGLYYVLVYSSCGHVVPEGADEECDAADCRHKEYLKSIEREEELEASHV